MVNSILLTSFLFWLALFHSGNWASPDKDIFILAGQSNMAGRGGVDNHKWNGNVPPESLPNSSILRLSAQLTWEEAHEPLHADIEVGKACGVGPGMAFANEIIRTSNGSKRVGLVPCAVGGTKIGEWGRGTRLYGELVSRARESLKEREGRICGVLWYQGESDTVRKEDAEAYKGKLEKFIGDLRSDLSNPSLPFIQVALASGEGKFVKTVRRAQLAIKLPNVRTIDANGLPLKTDHLHLTTTSEVQLGRKLAHAYVASFGHML